MKSPILHSIPAVILTFSGFATGGVPAEPAVEIPAPATGWEFRVQLYGWLTGLDGTTAVGPLAADVDASFGDIFEQLEMAAALQFEARNGRWGIIADGFYCELGASGSPPGPLYDEVEVGLKQFTGELSVAYRIYESPNAFVDLYAGMRYNDLSLDFDASLDPPGITAASANASERVVDGLTERAEAIVLPKIATYQAAGTARRAVIEARIITTIEAEAEERVKSELKKQLLQILRDGGLNARDIASNRIVRNIKAEHLALARSTAQLEVARLRASVDASLQSQVNRARAGVRAARRNLAAAIDGQLQARLPVSASANKDWLDPILGVRAQWNFNDKWFLAGKSDIGGFGVGSDLDWTIQATVGYHFTPNVSAELGYRYLHTDYSDGAFTYDLAQAGIYTGLNFRF